MLMVFVCVTLCKFSGGVCACMWLHWLKQFAHILTDVVAGGRGEEDQLDHPVHPEISQARAERLPLPVRQPGLLPLPRPDRQQPQRVLRLRRQQACALLLQERVLGIVNRIRFSDRL